jgi:CRISP-associated protein Cas1
MTTLYVSEVGAMVHKDGDQIKITAPKEGTLLKMPLSNLEQLVLLGNVTVSTAAVRSLLEKGAGLLYLSRGGKLLGRLESTVSKNIPLRWAQFQAVADADTRLAIAKDIVRGKLHNQRTLLQRSGRGGVDRLEKTVSHIKALVKRVEQVKTLNELRGIEGAAAAAYFRQWPQLIKTLGFPFSGRVRRPPTDPVNSLISFGYVLLMNEVLTACQVVGFDPYLGFLHMDRYGRPALALDLMEEFRPVIVDSLVLSFINRRMVEPEDFEIGLGGVRRMKPSTLKKFLAAWEAKRATLITHPIFDRQVPYWRLVELQARLMGKRLTGEAEHYVPFLNR